MLSADEVVRFLEPVSGLKARVALMTAYAAGLRVSEVAALKVSDIDSRRMMCGECWGGKERCAMLSEALGILRDNWRLARPWPFLFPVGRPTRRSSRACCMSLPIGDSCGGGGQACERACPAA